MRRGQKNAVTRHCTLLFRSLYQRLSFFVDRSTLFFSFTPFKKYVKKIRLRETPLEDSASGPLLPLGFLCRRPLVDLPDEVVENLQGHRQWHGQTEANMQNH